MAKKKSVRKDPIPKPYSGNALGYWSFVVGFVVAILTGVASFFNLGSNQVLVFILIIAGIIIGFFNIKDHEATEFMLAGTVLVIVSWFGQTAVTQVLVYADILAALSILFVPATIIVALRSLFVLSHR